MSEPAPQTVKHQAHPGKYFHMMLNMADDDLDPFEYRLLGHYIRKGVCTEGIAKTAEICKMSVAKVRATRLALEKLGYISIEQVSGKGTKITIIDRMAENVQRCTPTKSVRGKHKETPIENVRGEDIVTPIENDSPPLPKTSGVPLSKTSPKEEHIQEPSQKNIPKVPESPPEKPVFGSKDPQTENTSTKEKPRDPIFDGIAAIYVEPGKNVNGFGGWIGRVIQWIKEIEPELTGEQAQSFGVWWPKENKFAAKTKDKTKIQAAFAAWRNTREAIIDWVIGADGIERKVTRWT